MPPQTTRWILAVAVCAVVAGGAVRGAPAGAESPFDATTTQPELFEMARGAVGLDDFALAEQCYREILLRYPDNLDAMLELASAYERVGKLEYARGLLTRAAALAPQNGRIVERRQQVDKVLAVVLVEEIKEAITARNYDSALAKISLRLSIAPETDTLRYLRALCLVEIFQYDAALKEVDRAIQMDPQQTYYDLRQRIADARTQASTGGLKERARHLAASDHADERDEAARLLGEVLEQEPDNEWARSTFFALTTPDSTFTNATGIVAGIIAAVDRLGDFVAGAGRFLERHLTAAVLLLLAWFILRSPISRAISGRFAKPPMLSGQLARFSLPEILLMLNAEPHSGILHVQAKGIRGKVFFSEGEPCHCTVGKLTGNDALIHLINESRDGFFIFREGSLPLGRSIETPLSLILIEQARGIRTRETPNTKRVDGRKSKMKELLESKSR